MPYRVSDIEPDKGDIHTGSRQCRTCRNRYPMENFYLTTSGVHRRRKCKGCVEDERRQRVERILLDPVESAKFKGMKRWGRIKTRYGLTPADFGTLLQEQDSRCAICTVSFEEEDPHIDHCHKTGKIRGLLCSPCNRGIGQLRDDPQILMTAAKYLERNA